MCLTAAKKEDVSNTITKHVCMGPAVASHRKLSPSLSCSGLSDFFHLKSSYYKYLISLTMMQALLCCHRQCAYKLLVVFF